MKGTNRATMLNAINTIETLRSRPAPAATDTGLETVAKLGGINGVMLLRHIENLRPEAQAAYKYELVRRSQADERLAAERAKVQHWQEQYTEMHSQFIQLAKSAEADNAAKDARIKEIEEEWRVAANLGSEVNRKLAQQVVSLEAKLAAAERAARAAHDTLIEINPSNYNHDDVCQLNDASVEAIFLLADILGETHGKTKEWWDERRAVLGGKPS
ncbi:hypothetical protein [Brucella tritici]|uniref:Uncharacterized protein n=1 Tax=Brucella tritici TaxID=94626 RepID=A0A6L3YVZ4_9HYPH|nr:hypothetical protein [Brucella tritici]KAB2689678.1 hypothetical protein F9L08_03195 [Brucella tritici]